MTASELASQASNDADLYKRQIQPIIKNLGRKKYKGIFNRDLAIKLFRYAVPPIILKTPIKLVDTIVNQNNLPVTLSV